MPAPHLQSHPEVYGVADFAQPHRVATDAARHRGVFLELRALQ